MKPVLTYPSWTDLEKGCHVIARKLTQQNFRPETIIGLIRGGSYPATTLAYIFDIGKENVFHISYSSKDGKGDGGGSLNNMPNMLHQNILIVDDIADSGNSLKNVVDYYKSFNKYNVFSASLYHKHGACIIPDACWQEISRDADWIIFPYEH